MDKDQEHTVPAGKFKAQCLKLMDEVQRTRIPLTITKHGKPVATLTPAKETEPPPLYGRLKGSVTIRGDIIASSHEEWQQPASDPLFFAEKNEE